MSSGNCPTTGVPVKFCTCVKCQAPAEPASQNVSSVQSGSIEGELNTAAQAAYLELLLTMRPERRRTVAGQRLLAQLRDAIARCTGNTPEAIQNIFEDRVRSILSEPRLVQSEQPR